ncbi:chromosomal replication initiator DnaA [Albirhodobacter sp. R86504]|jgi:chromosomal replication initiation ATPase DnaA|uniref:chromosomal replication initiator DnaA n=1 Tax=Albirhodobacter sp. R86504 TaxID=3093848 RepID=UPI00366BAB4B
MSEQLVFDLGVRTARGRDDFFVSASNALALATLDAPSAWPSGKLIVVGEPGAGKTHLAAIWALEHNAAVVKMADLRADDAPRLAQSGAVVVEDADRLTSRAQEEALFHLHNLVLAQGGRLLLTARKVPRDWGVEGFSIGLPDLISRMQAASIVRLDAPDEALLSVVLVKMFSDRQILVPAALIPWLVTRMDRSMEMARALVAALDSRSLAEKRAVTRAMAAQVLDSLDARAQD